MTLPGAAIESGRESSEVVLEATGLRLGYGRKEVVEVPRLSVRRGELWFLVGPNGAGKSTFFKAVLGMIRPLAGALELAPELASRRRTGFVPQRWELKHTLPMTVEELVDLGLVGASTPRRERREAAAWALEKVGLLERRRADYASLSGGQKQRALIARGIVRRPRLLILDEPTNSLDAAAEEALLRLVEELNRSERLTVLFVTHTLLLAIRFASHAAVFGGGTVVAGARSDVLTRTHLRRAYGVDLDVRWEEASVHVERAAPGGGADWEGRDDR